MYDHIIKVLEIYNINSKEFTEMIKKTLNSNPSYLNDLLENVYEEIMNDKEILNDNYDLIYGEMIKKLYTLLQQIKTNDKIIIQNLINKSEKYLPINNSINCLSMLYIIQNLKYYIKENYFNKESYSTKKIDFLDVGKKHMTGFFLEQLNLQDNKWVGKNAKILKENDWKNWIQNKYTDLKFIPHSLDIYSKEQNALFEVKNLYIKNIESPLDFLQKKNIKKQLKEQLQFGNLTKNDLFVMITNTKNFEKILVPLKELRLLVDNNKISFQKIKDFILEKYPYYYQEPIQQQKITTDINSDDFWNKTVQLFQKNLKYEYLFFEAETKEMFSDYLDNYLLNNINSIEELKEKLWNGYYPDIPNEEFNDYIDDFFININFQDKISLKLSFKSFKNFINNHYELKGRNVVTLDKSFLEHFYRMKKFRNTFNSLDIPENILEEETNLNKFLTNLAQKIDLSQLEKTLKERNMSNDILNRIKRYIPNENHQLNLNL